MRTSTIIWIIVIIVVILGGWYWWMSMGATPTTSQTAPTDQTAAKNAPQVPAPTVVLTSATDPKLGTYLVASNGMTLYMYTKDATNTSNCSGACATAWPPYTVASGTPIAAGSGITGTVATITRADDGSSQVTYNGMPLYFWAKDTKPGDTTGQNVGKVWFVVKP